MDRGIRHVLNVTADCPNFHPNAFVYHRISVEDCDKARFGEELLRSGFRFIEQGIEAGGVLVHCKEGISRSASVVIAYLMTSAQQSLLQAYLHTKKRRECISPNPGFMTELSQLETSLTNHQTIDPHHYREERFGYFFDIVAYPHKYPSLSRRATQVQ